MDKLNDILVTVQNETGKLCQFDKITKEEAQSRVEFIFSLMNHVSTMVQKSNDNDWYNPVSI